MKRRCTKGYFNNIIKELKVEDRFVFREMFRMDVSDFKNDWAKISDMIEPKERLGGTEPIKSDERFSIAFIG